MPIYNIFDKQVVNPGRQIELAAARGLAVLFMIAVHVLRSFSNEIVINSLGKIVSCDKQVNFAEVGAKAKALIETTNAGMPVPEGIVLSVSFFKEWLYEIKASKVWKVMLLDVTKDYCDQVKYLAEGKRFAEG